MTAQESLPRIAALQIAGADAGYGRTQVLREVTLSVEAASVVALLGPNGAGKTTLLRVASGLLRPSRGSVSVGGREVTGLSAHERAAAGVCLIPEGRGVFRSLTVRENLELQIPPWTKGTDIEAAVTAFPALAGRLNQTAGSLSGGEQQMVALSRAYLSQAKVVLLDEVSMGLAPVIVENIFDSLAQLAATQVALVIVEQYARQALKLADQAVLLTRGEVAWSGPAQELDPDTLAAGYLGRSGGT